MVRLLLILAMVWHLLSMGFAIDPVGVPTEHCLAVSCCDVVKLNACCDVAPTDHFCERSHGSCQCGVSPGDAPDRLPEAPLPRGGNETQPLFAQLEATQIVEISDSTSHAFATKAAPFVHRSHNQVQALLCVWRT
jgi:hypothetical protein